MVCPNCGNNIPDNSNACGYCGARFGAPAQQFAPNGVPAYAAPAAPAPAPQKSKKKVGMILGIVGGALVTTIISIVVLTSIHTCYECDDTIFGGNMVDYEYFCDDCYDDLPECTECDEKFIGDEDNLLGYYICDDCLEELRNSLLGYGYY